MIGRLDEQKLAVGIASSHNQTVDLFREVKKQRNDEPFVLDVVAKIRDAVKMWWKLF